MNYYGPWIQDDDYTASVGQVTQSGTVNTTRLVTRTVDGAQAPADPSIFQEVLNDAATGALSGTTQPPAVGYADGTITGHINFDGGVSGPWSTIYTAGRVVTPAGYSAWANQANQFTATMPPDAIGVEYEGWAGESLGFSEVVSAELHFGTTNANVDDTVSPWTTANGSWQIGIIVCQDGTFDNVQYPGSRVKDALIDWDGALDGVAGTAVLTLPPGAETDPPTVEHVIDATPYLYGGPNDGFLVLLKHVDSFGGVTLASYSTDAAGCNVGAGLSPSTMVYTLRPPRYRFLYAGTPKTHSPACRQWGRDDGMAASSARRQYPPPSSRQRSNRRAGGYD